MDERHRNYFYSDKLELLYSQITCNHEINGQNKLDQLQLALFYFRTFL